MAELLHHYKKRQVEDRLSGGSQSRGSVKQPPSKCYSVCYEPYGTDESLSLLYFIAQYRRAGRFSYQMMAPGKVQVSGFCDTDHYTEVVMKRAKGLNINANPESLQLLVSGGLVTNCLLQDGKEWTLRQ